MLKILRKLLNLGNLAESFKKGEISVFYIGYGPGYDQHHIEDNEVTEERFTAIIEHKKYAFLRIGLRFKSEDSDSDVNNQVWLEYDTKKPEGRLYFSVEGSRNRKPQDDEKIMGESAKYLEDKL